MRPARKGPENRRRDGLADRRDCRFNEAGPQGAGKPRFRLVRVVEPLAASMRPARKGPENQQTKIGHTKQATRFNEAGPQGAGKPSAPSR